MKKQVCNNCTYFTAYYKQWSDCFGRTNNGFCEKQQRGCKEFETCSDFKSNELKELRREQKCMRTLSNALKALIEIAMILKEKESQ